MSAVKSVELKDGNVLELHHDSDPSSPRDDDNLGIVAVFHNRYDFGDSVDFSADDFSGWDEMEEHIKKTYRPVAILPIYMYDHSGITIKTTPFSCGWDSGQVGFTWTTNKQIDQFGCGIQNHETWPMYVERLEDYLRAELDTLDTYVRGEIYGFQIKDEEGEIVDSCWGFYGDDIKENGVLDHVGEDNIVNLDDL